MLGIEGPLERIDLARRIVGQFPNLSHVAMTVRDGSSATLQHFGGVLYDAATQVLYEAPTYPISHVVDRLGAGDAFTAGLVYSFLQNWDSETSISFATAAGCLAHSIEGDYNYSTHAEIEALMKGDGGGRVSR